MTDLIAYERSSTHMCADNRAQYGSEQSRHLRHAHITPQGLLASLDLAHSDIVCVIVHLCACGDFRSWNTS